MYIHVIVYTVHEVKFGSFLLFQFWRFFQHFVNPHNHLLGKRILKLSFAHFQSQFDRKTVRMPSAPQVAAWVESVMEQESCAAWRVSLAKLVSRPLPLMYATVSTMTLMELKSSFLHELLSMTRMNATSGALTQYTLFCFNLSSCDVNSISAQYVCSGSYLLHWGGQLWVITFAKK